MSYVTLASGTTRYESFIPVQVRTLDTNNEFIGFDVWDDASDSIKQRALNQATKYIDSFTYNGEKKVSTQDKQFPRKGQDTVPEEVKDACFILTLELLKRNIVHIESPDQVQRYKDIGVENYSVTISNASESVTFKEEESLFKLVHPYLKKWMKGGYNITKRTA